MKKTIVWISAYAPYDKVAHAGGQIHNYYLKNLSRENDLNIELISFGDSKEKEIAEQDLNRYKINNTIYAWDSEKVIIDIYRRFLRQDGIRNPFSRYAGATDDYYFLKIKNALKDIVPDIFILEWTQVVLFLPRLKKLYPKSKFVAIEEDVMYLSYFRKMISAKSLLDRYVKTTRYNRLKEKELYALCEAELVILNNPKDEELVKSEGIKKTWHWTPYFNNMVDLKRSNTITKNIVFFGAMSRAENHDSVMWFIDNVFNRIEDKEVRFIVIGNKPRQELIEMANDRIIVTGFVDSVEPYFKDALCCVAPLVMGAGVKIKVLEALSAGVPVLTNDIGIEGIPAIDGKEYLHCTNQEDYLVNINKLLADPDFSEKISQNAKLFMDANYDYLRDADLFVKKLEEL